MTYIRHTKRYGWRPQLPDKRDFRLTPPVPGRTLPPSFDLRPLCPPVYDQGELGSCTANALAAAHQFEQMRQVASTNAGAIFIPSRLFIYYNERVIEGTVDQDAGAELRDGMKSLAAQGVCPESQWPYVEASFAARPKDECYAAAEKYEALQYLSLNQDLDALRGCLADGFPFVFGFTAYESFESAQVAQSGVVTLPTTGEPVLGGHAVMAVGYDDVTQTFLVRNSWGPSWGRAGHFTMPYAYLTDPDLASDFWTLRLVE